MIPPPVFCCRSVGSGPVGTGAWHRPKRTSTSVPPGYVTGLCQGWGMNAGVAGTIASLVNTLLAVIGSYPLLKFWVMPKSGDTTKESAR